MAQEQGTMFQMNKGLGLDFTVWNFTTHLVDC